MSKWAVELDNFEVAYGKGNKLVYGLRNLTAKIPAGVISGLAGPDGAGKTTLLRFLAGLLKQKNGSYRIFGETRPFGNIGYMPQKFGLYEDLSVIANLRLQASLREVPPGKREQIFSKLLDFTGLARFRERLAGNLSGGMKQKLAIACALLGAPRLLLLDEPGVGVDPQSRRELWSMAQQLHSEGMTIIWATSYMDEAQRCPHILILENGAALWQGKPEDLIKREDGLVFQLPQDLSSGSARREALIKWSENRNIEDAIIEGANLRLTLSPNAPSQFYAEIKKRGEPAVPNLSDAYMTMVGGINHAPSPFVEILASKPAVASGKTKIKAEHLTKKFGNFTAANDITFSVASGEIFGLLGPNGAGKSTTFRMLCGLSRPTSGSCSVDGVDLLRSQSEARAKIGYMAQKFSLYQDISVRENINICAQLYGMNKNQREKIINQLVRALGLEYYLDAHAGELPIGLKQRLSLLAATMHDPAVIFLDEPTSGVDIRARRDFWKHITALTSKGAAILVTTHFMEEAEYCDRIALLYRGEIISMGQPSDLKAAVKDIINPTLEDAFIASIEKYDADHPL